MKIGKYRHFKGGIVQVIGVGNHSETLEEFVIYKALYNCKTFGKNSLWVRNKKMFCETIRINNKFIYRFTFIGE